MADWQFHLELGDVYNEEADINKLAGIVAERLKALAIEIREKKHIKFKAEYKNMAKELEQDIIPLFEEVRDETYMDTDDFDNAMETLYDWADTPLERGWGGAKMCWINTFTPVRKESNGTPQD